MKKMKSQMSTERTPVSTIRSVKNDTPLAVAISPMQVSETLFNDIEKIGVINLKYPHLYCTAETSVTTNRKII